MKRILRSFARLTILWTVFMTSCTTVLLTSVWNDQTYKGHPKNILVIAAVYDSDVKRSLEQEFIVQLKAQGIAAVASFSVFGDDVMPGKGALADQIQDQGADAVLISSVNELQAVTLYIPGTSYAPPYYYGTWYDYYSAVPLRPGYAIQDSYAVLETNLYDVRTERLVWTAASETYEKSFGLRWTKSYVETIIKKLANQNVLRPAVERAAPGVNR